MRNSEGEESRGGSVRHKNREVEREERRGIEGGAHYCWNSECTHFLNFNPAVMVVAKRSSKFPGDLGHLKMVKEISV